MATPPVFTAGAVLTAAQMNGIGFWLVKTQTIGSAVASVTVTDAFSADYDNYVISVTGGVASAGTSAALTLGSASTGYYFFTVSGLYSGTTITGSNTSNGASFASVVRATANSLHGVISVFDPFNTKTTHVLAQTSASGTGAGYFTAGGFLNDTTSYTAFTLTLATGTMTGGNIKVYGYRN
jgi:hypothetical protein